MGQEKKNCRTICDLFYKWKENPISLQATKIHHIWIPTHAPLKTLHFCPHDFMCLFKKIKKIFPIEVLQCKYLRKYQYELCGGWRGVLDRRANGSMHNSLLLSSCFCQVASSKLRKEKGHRSIHAVTLGIPCVVMGCVMTATKPWCAIDCYRTLKTIGHYLASITTQLFKCETLANVSKETVPVWFSKEGDWFIFNPHVRLES